MPTRDISKLIIPQIKAFHTLLEQNGKLLQNIAWKSLKLALITVDPKFSAPILNATVPGELKTSMTAANLILTSSLFPSFERCRSDVSSSRSRPVQGEKIDDLSVKTTTFVNWIVVVTFRQRLFASKYEKGQ
jgi:hypothetical protein